MKKLLLVPFLFAIGAVTVSAQTTTTVSTTVAASSTVSAGLTPESPFYFLDKIMESIQEAFTFSPEAKVKLELALAAERVAEAKAMLATPGDHSQGLNEIQSSLIDNVKKTGETLKEERNSGKDVSGLAKEANDELDSQESDLNKTLSEAHKTIVENKIESYKKMLEQAKEAKDEAKASDAEKNLQDMQQIADELKSQREAIRTSFHEEKKAIEDQMSKDDQDEDKADTNEDVESENEGTTSVRADASIRVESRTGIRPESGDQEGGDQGEDGGIPDGRR